MIRTTIVAALAALALAGCAGDKDLQRAQAEERTRASELGIERARADAEESKAVARLAEKIDAGGAAAYLTAKVLARGGVQGTTTPAPAPVVQVANPIATAFGAVLQVADLALRAYGIKAGRDTAIASTNAQRDTAIASYGAFTSMGGSIERAGTAGYPFVQVPQPNVTNTISGNGVIGSGSYIGPVTTTTTRTCNGGTGAAGGNGAGTTTGGAGGAGGAAPGGTC